MSAAAPPTIPPRPVRAEQAAAHGASKLPEIPPRPLPKRMERAPSPANYPQSPLNEPFSLHKVKSVEPQAPRPPSVHHLPTPGEEGMEYANVQYQPAQPASGLAQDAAAQTRRVGDELQLHAPKPSLPKSSATAQVQAVTRTDSVEAASPGLDKHLTHTKSRGSFSRPDSAGSGFRRSSNDPGDDHGPMETIGLRVPINPLLGDVQAPTPSGLSPQATGESGRRHSRRRSQMDDFRPPGSYGLHGHGIIPQDKFERDWYMKHPDQLEHEEGQGHGVYEGIGSGRGNFALSREELNKIVRDTASRGSSFGTREEIRSFPDEQIGYMASEEYQRSQQNTPLPELSRTQTQLSQPAVESPLRKASFPAEDAINNDVKKSKKSSSIKSEHALDSEGEDFHIDLPGRRFNKVTGGQETINETEGAKPYASHPDDHGEYRVPILAEDEIAKDIGAEYMQPAVSPKYERRGSAYGNEEHGSGHHTPLSRPSSRPGSVYNLHSASHSLSRFLSHQDEREHMHTPLEDVAEYEPLFDDDDGKKALSHAERFKRRPDALQKRFPSMDIWEDTPNSAYHVAEVSTPDLPSTAKEPKLEDPSTFELPEKEAAREGEYSEAEKREQVSKEERLHKSKFAPHLRDAVSTRPGLIPRFPSQDIWEDSPDSSQLVTTVSSPPIDDEEKPPVPARPSKSRLGEGASSNQMEPSVPPSIPARPQKRVHAVPAADATLTDAIPLARESSPTELKKVPSIPDRPKPQIPPRPAKTSGDDGLTKVTSSGSAESAETVITPATVKAKPQVPPRPAAGNFANLKGNFMNDLNKKLGLGPPKEKEKEPESEPKEVKPLEDARKGRARGPQRRAPAKSPSATSTKPVMSFSISSPQSIWSINDEGSLSVGIEKAKELMSKEKIAQIDHAAPADAPLPPTIDTTTKAGQVEAERPSDAPNSLASGLARNTAGEMADPVSGINDDDNPEGELTRKTTASTISGQPLEREETDPNADAIPASRQTTATDSEQNDTDEKLERVLSEERQAENIAEDEPIKIRHEQVNAAAPDTSANAQTSSSASQGSTSDSAHSNPTDNKGEEAPKEPMNEDDVNYKKLEEMTAKADGKLHAEEEPSADFSSRKVVD